jgi:hypothetical protein
MIVDNIVIINSIIVLCDMIVLLYIVVDDVIIDNNIIKLNNPNNQTFIYDKYSISLNIKDVEIDINIYCNPIV